MRDAPTALQGPSVVGAPALQASDGDELRAAYDAALAFANVLRVTDGHEPVPALVMGARGDCQRCPIANTANMGKRHDASRWEVGAVAVKIGPKSGRPVATAPQFPVPIMAVEFMAAFDAGAFPELVA